LAASDIVQEIDLSAVRMGNMIRLKAQIALQKKRFSAIFL